MKSAGRWTSFRRSSGEPTLFDLIGPETITVLRGSLKPDFRDPEQLKEQLRITVLHELAH